MEESSGKAGSASSPRRSRRRQRPLPGATNELLNDDVLSDFFARPCVKRAIDNPWHPSSVLSFLTGIDCTYPKCHRTLLNKTKLAEAMNPVIPHLGDQYHALCQPFSPVVRAAGKEELVSTPDCDWDSVDGIVARIVLCSQMARSCFRGQREAYAYSDVSVALTQRLQQLAQETIHDNNSAKTKPDYSKLKKSFASMSILASLYTSEKKETPSDGFFSPPPALTRSTTGGGGSASTGSTPPACITLTSCGSGSHSLSSDSLSDLDDGMGASGELNSILETPDEESSLSRMR